MEIEVVENKPAPDFTLIGSDGLSHSLSEFIGKKVILYFYPKDNTPGCTKEACSFRDMITQITDLNAVVIGISRDKNVSHNNFISKFGLPFLLLSDTEEVACQLYGVLKWKVLYGKKSLGIERSTFVIDENGNIMKIFRKVKVDGHVEQILDYIKNSQ